MISNLKNLKLGDLLLQNNSLTEMQLDLALKEQRNTKMMLGEILIKKGWLSEMQLVEALSAQLKIPMVTLSRYHPMPEALKLVPQHVAARLRMVPLKIEDDGSLMIATSDPLNLVVTDEIKMLTGRELSLRLCPLSQITRDLDRIYSVQESFDDAEIEVVDTSVEGLEIDLSTVVASSSAQDAPVIKIVNNIIEQAIKEGASDIHIEPFEKNTQVRFRVDGQLFNAIDFSRVLHPAVTSRIKIMSNIDISEKRKAQDGRIVIKALNKKVDLRVSTLPTIYGEKTVIRLLDQSNAMVGLEKLGFEQIDRDLVDQYLKLPYGIILLTGPTGSGKSTTLYSFLEKINTPDVNIVTVEDPVEYSISGINQVQVNEKAGRTFSAVLRSILRQDPDKIMIGEIRDVETAQLSIRAALTGHLVLSTLHTNDAPSAPLRLGDMGVPPFLVASSLNAIIAQRLVRKLCPDCREKYIIPDNLCSDLKIEKGSTAWRPVGCNLCRGTGYAGRTSIFEIMSMSPSIKKMIIDQENSNVIRTQAISEGMRTLREAGIVKILGGVTSMEEMLHVTI